MYRYLIFQSYNESLKINPQRKDAHLNIGTILHLQVCNFSVNHFSSKTVMSDICTHVGKSLLAVLSVHVHPLCLFENIWWIQGSWHSTITSIIFFKSDLFTFFQKHYTKAKYHYNQVLKQDPDNLIAKENLVKLKKIQDRHIRT